MRDFCDLLDGGLGWRGGVLGREGRFVMCVLYEYLYVMYSGFVNFVIL